VSAEWRRVIGGLILAGGFLTAITLILFVTHPCGPAYFEGELAIYDDCGAVAPALVVTGISLTLGVPLLLSGRRPSVKWLVVASLGLLLIVLAMGVGALRILTTALLCQPRDDCGTKGFLPGGGGWILILGGLLSAVGGIGYLLVRRRDTPASKNVSPPLAA
jgi:hypothetical protein